MGRRIAWILVLVAACIGGWFLWQHYKAQNENGGDFACVGCMTPEQKAAFDKENSGDTADGQSEHKTRTARQDDAAGFPDAAAPASKTAIPATAPTNTATTPAAAPAATPTAAPALQPTYTASNNAAPSALPVSDTLSPNAPNGMAFGGSGIYQWYRQGNLTYRINTKTGRSCIAYATMEEWEKQIVFSHGCGRNA